MFAVAAGEFGIILCLALVGAVRLRRDPHADARLRRARTCSRASPRRGLAILFGVQAAINMAVNLQLILLPRA